MVQPRNDLSSDDDYDSGDEHEPWTKAHQCRMIKSVVLDSLMTGFYQEWPLDKPDPKQKKLRSPGIEPRSLNYR
jgi:hypothetical protein